MQANMQLYKQQYGVDLGVELQDSLKRIYKKVECNYVTPRGYVVLANADGKLIDISNKLSYLTNGKALIGYHRLRQTHLDCTQIDYLDLVDAFKQS